ncbi:N-acetylglucosaminyldiphosphodolichol N-acetylglucosaminyltransferase catalytic subunit alg13 [Diaporthe australafricana]|uniref:UDP-N-acetylglucosamine transferase subunit ALG13 n=1 Tax=Diaporthe australafricana TaxID=127596 RepID=A0ABR3WA18_9PEZI
MPNQATDKKLNEHKPAVANSANFTTDLVDFEDDSSEFFSAGSSDEFSEISYGEATNPNERERFKRVIRLDLYGDDEAMGRCMLVTGGATVPFVGLLKEVTSEIFLAMLRAHDFTHLYLQCGTAHDQIEARIKNGNGLMQIETFSFCRDLKSLMREHCRGEKGGRPAGVVMGHAGTGTISDAMEVDCALIIVANTTLMDDHQSLFASEMATEHPTIVQAHLGNLMASIAKSIHVIEDNGLDNLEPYKEPGLPQEQQLTFIDEVVADASQQQASNCITQ